MMSFGILIILGFVSVVFTVIVLVIWFSNRRKSDDGE